MALLFKKSSNIPAQAGTTGAVTVSVAFNVLANCAESSITPPTADTLEDGQFVYGLLPNNLIVKLRRSGTQYLIKSLFKQPADIAYPIGTDFYVIGNQTYLAIAANVTIATTGFTVIQLEPNPLSIGTKVAATVGGATGIIERTATDTRFTPEFTLSSPLSLTAYVDAAIIGTKTQTSIFNGFTINPPTGKYWFSFEDFVGNLGFGLLRNYTFIVNSLRIKNILIEQESNTKYLYRVFDSTKKLLLGVWYNGTLEANKVLIGKTLFEPLSNWKYILYFADRTGKVALGFLRTGGVELEQVSSKNFSLYKDKSLLLKDLGNQIYIPELKSNSLTTKIINRVPKVSIDGFLHYFPGQGQSNMTGYQVNAYIARFSRAQLFNSYMLQESSLGINYFNNADTIKLAPFSEPMRIGGGSGYPQNIEGSSSLWGISRALCESHLGRDFISGWDNLGRGGQPYSVVGPGGSGNYYASSITSLQHFVRLAAEKGLKVKVPCVPIIHGESDSENTSYDTNLLSWYTAANTDYKAATGQVENIPLAICQQAAYPWANPPLDLSWRVSRDNPGKIICVEPSWHYHCGDQAHLDEWSRELRRAIKWAQVIDISCFQRRSWRPLEPISATIVSSTVVIKFNVPSGPLQWDRHITQPTNLYINGAVTPNPWINGRGFELRNASNNPVSITKAEITASDTVTLSFTGGTPTQVGFARTCPWDGVTTTLQAGPETSRRGQLIDSDPHVGFDYQIVECVVTEGSNIITIPKENAVMQGTYNFVNGLGLPYDCIIRTRTSESSFTLSDPWKGGTGTTTLTMWSDQRNRCVIFNLAI